MTTDKNTVLPVYRSSLNYVSIKWLLPLWKICNSESGKTLKDITWIIALEQDSQDNYPPRCSHDTFKHLKNTTVYVLLILTWKSILDDTWEIYWRCVKKYKSSHNLDKSTTVKILFKRSQQILDNPNRMKDTNPIWIMDKTFY